MHSYRVAGLAVASEIELSGAIPARHVSAPAVTVRVAPVPTGLEDATKRGVTWQIAGDRFLFQVPGVARFCSAAAAKSCLSLRPASQQATFRFF